MRSVREWKQQKTREMAEWRCYEKRRCDDRRPRCECKPTKCGCGCEKPRPDSCRPRPTIPTEGGVGKYILLPDGWTELTEPQVEGLVNQCFAASRSSQCHGFRMARNAPREVLDRNTFFAFPCPWVYQNCENGSTVRVDQLRAIPADVLGSEPNPVPGCRAPCGRCNTVKACASTESQNLALGLGTLARGIDSGTFNLAVGTRALSNNTTGCFNVAVGRRALNNNSEGFTNAAFGLDALRLNTTGNSNTALGATAMVENTTGNHNTACGTASLNSNKTGSFNAAFGFEALLSNTSGDANCAIGTAALQGNMIGSSNVAVGVNALSAFNDATDQLSANVAIGRNAGVSAVLGKANTMVGANAGQRATDAGTSNVLVGFGASSGTTGPLGHRNTVVGTGAQSSTFSDSIVIGHFAEASSDHELVFKGPTVDDPEGPNPMLQVTINDKKYRIALIPA